MDNAESRSTHESRRTGLSILFWKQYKDISDFLFQSPRYVHAKIGGSSPHETFNVVMHIDPAHEPDCVIQALPTPFDSPILHECAKESPTLIYLNQVHRHINLGYANVTKPMNLDVNDYVMMILALQIGSIDRIFYHSETVNSIETQYEMNPENFSNSEGAKAYLEGLEFNWNGEFARALLECGWKQTFP